MLERFMVATSSAVLPAPGDDMKLRATTPWPSKWSRLCAAATRSFVEQAAEHIDGLAILGTGLRRRTPARLTHSRAPSVLPAFQARRATA